MKYCTVKFYPLHLIVTVLTLFVFPSVQKLKQTAY